MRGEEPIRKDGKSKQMKFLKSADNLDSVLNMLPIYLEQNVIHRSIKSIVLSLDTLSIYENGIDLKGPIHKGWRAIPILGGRHWFYIESKNEVLLVSDFISFRDVELNDLITEIDAAEKTMSAAWEAKLRSEAEERIAQKSLDIEKANEILAELRFQLEYIKYLNNASKGNIETN